MRTAQADVPGPLKHAPRRAKARVVGLLFDVLLNRHKHMRLGAVMCTVPLDELTRTFRQTLFGCSRMCQSPQGLTIFGYSFWGKKSQRRMYSTMAARNALEIKRTTPAVR